MKRITLTIIRKYTGATALEDFDVKMLLKKSRKDILHKFKFKGESSFLGI